MERMNAEPIIRFQIDKIVCIRAPKAQGCIQEIVTEIVKETDVRPIRRQ